MPEASSIFLLLVRRSEANKCRLVGAGGEVCADCRLLLLLLLVAIRVNDSDWGDGVTIIRGLGLGEMVVVEVLFRILLLAVRRVLLVLAVVP